MTKKKNTDPVDSIRGAIDAIDDEIVDLLNRRAALAQDVGREKIARGVRLYAPERERILLERIAEKSSGPLPVESLRLIYKEIISASLALEGPVRVAFLGPEATYTHDATKRHFGSSAKLDACSTIPDVFVNVERGRSDYGVVPIENSTEGIVTHTLDMFVTSDLLICAEVMLEVSHHLLSRGGAVDQITRICSHPQALAQCRGWLDANLPNITRVDVSSTARAAQLAAEDDHTAAVASDLAASLYGLRAAASHIEDVRGNRTRFLIIGRDEPEPSGKDRTSIMFALKDEPGVLYSALGAFAEAGINLSRIESRPSHRRAWDYLFFIDLDGHKKSAEVAAAIDDLQRSCVFMKVLGSYPQAFLPKRENKE